MKIHCYSCQKQSQAQSSALKCPHCRSQVVQYMNNQSQRQHSRHDTQFSRLFERQNRFNNEPIFTDPFSMFRMMQFGGFGNSLFDDGDMFVRGRGVASNHQFRTPLIDRMRMMDRNIGVDDNQPYYFRQIISNPHQTIIFSNNLYEPEQHQIQETEIKKQKLNISCLPKIKELKQECPICNLKENEGVMLPCKHAFHKDCLQPWLEIKDNCPCCRQKIL